MHKPKTGAERQAKVRAAGRQIAVVIRDAEALAALAVLEKKHGGVTPAVVHALKAAAG